MDQSLGRLRNGCSSRSALPPQRLWECGDTVIQNVTDTSFVATDQMARGAVSAMISSGWARIVNVTTKLGTANRAGSLPCGVKAALEMATGIWAKELAGTGVAANIENPEAGANTPDGIGDAGKIRLRRCSKARRA